MRTAPARYQAAKLPEPLGLAVKVTPKLGHVIHYQGTRLVLEPLRELVGNTVRANLRMPVDFHQKFIQTERTSRVWASPSSPK